jgi:hypothetical protein
VKLVDNPVAITAVSSVRLERERGEGGRERERVTMMMMGVVYLEV